MPFGVKVIDGIGQKNDQSFKLIKGRDIHFAQDSSAASSVGDTDIFLLDVAADGTQSSTTFVTASTLKSYITTNLVAGSATALETARLIGGVSFDGTADIDLPGVNVDGNQNTSGNAASATSLETARTIGGVSFDGTGNINLPGVNAEGNQDTTGNASTATKIASITNSNIVQLTATQTLTNKTLTSPVLTTPDIGTPSAGTLTNCTFPTLNQNTTGNAATVTNGVYTTNNLSVMSSTTSDQLAGVISDETGTGSLVFSNSPTLVTPALGTPASGVMTNVTGTASGLTAGAVTSIGTLSGEVTSTNRATVIADNVVDEANLKVSNAPTDGYVLTAQSGGTGGLTWAAQSPGGSSTIGGLNDVNTSGVAANDILVWDGQDFQVLSMTDMIANPTYYTFNWSDTLWTNTNDSRVFANPATETSVQSLIGSGNHQTSIQVKHVFSSSQAELFTSGVNGTDNLGLQTNDVNASTFTPHANLVYAVNGSDDTIQSATASHTINLPYPTHLNGNLYNRIKSEFQYDSTSYTHTLQYYYFNYMYLGKHIDDTPVLTNTADFPKKQFISNGTTSSNVISAYEISLTGNSQHLQFWYPDRITSTPSFNTGASSGSLFAENWTPINSTITHTNSRGYDETYKGYKSPNPLDNTTGVNSWFVQVTMS